MALKGVVQHDADLVDQAIRQLENSNISLARQLLSVLVARVPASYTYQYEQ